MNIDRRRLGASVALTIGVFGLLSTVVFRQLQLSDDANDFGSELIADIDAGGRISDHGCEDETFRRLPSGLRLQRALTEFVH